jgi:hypothetical protein
MKRAIVIGAAIVLAGCGSAAAAHDDAHSAASSGGQRQIRCVSIHTINRATGLEFNFRKRENAYKCAYDTLLNGSIEPSLIIDIGGYQSRSWTVQTFRMNLPGKKSSVFGLGPGAFLAASGSAGICQVVGPSKSVDGSAPVFMVQLTFKPGSGVANPSLVVVSAARSLTVPAG